jgi:hypothetical protein
MRARVCDDFINSFRMWHQMNIFATIQPTCVMAMMVKCVRRVQCVHT